MTDTPPAHSRKPQSRQLRHEHLAGWCWWNVAFAAVGGYLLLGVPHLLALVFGWPILVIGILAAVMPPVNNEKRRRRHAKRIAALVEARRLAPAAAPVAEAEGECRILGRVHVLASARRADSDVAAVLSRFRRHGKIDAAIGRHAVTDLNEDRSCGRFAVIDDSGVAVIDPAHFEVLSSIELDPFEPVTISARHDDTVEVIGTGRRVPTHAGDDVAELLGAPACEEGEPTVLLFDGQDDPVLVVARRRD